MRKGNGTKFTIDRKIFSSDIWYASPWKLKIWIYLLGQANYKTNDYMGMKIKRGQLIKSYRQLAKDCSYKIGYRLKKPSLRTVRRICEELMKDERMTIRRTHLGTLFTITNYDRLQRFNKPRTPQRTPFERPSRATLGKQSKERLKKEIRKKEYKYSGDDMNLIKTLKTQILVINPDHIFRGKDWLDKNAQQIRLMREQDKRKLEDIKRVVDFAFKDQFWSGIIQSANSLRKNYDTMKGQIRTRGSSESPSQKRLRELKEKERRNDRERNP